ncbi:MAG: transposase [Oligoflexia bacterium]|nr:transposase [Oligoflexia bacterium]
MNITIQHQKKCRAGADRFISKEKIFQVKDKKDIPLRSKSKRIDHLLQTEKMFGLVLYAVDADEGYLVYAAKYFDVFDENNKESSEAAGTGDNSGNIVDTTDDKSSNSSKNKDGSTASQAESNPSLPIPPKPQPRPNHKGKRKADQLQGATIVDCYPDLRPGDRCPLDCGGKVYLFLRDGDPREIISFTFEQPFKAIVYKMHDVRCNFCLTVFKAPLPENVLKNGGSDGGIFYYDYPALAALSMLHFGFGMPMYRLDQFQSLVGERFPESTQFDQLEFVADTFNPMVKYIYTLGANCMLMQGDDIANRVHSLQPILKQRRSDNKITYREGIHSSLFIGTINEGHLVPIIKTGIIHFGELLDEILLLRTPGLPVPRLVCDGSGVNTSSVTLIEKGGCWAHLREYAKAAKKNFPVEAKFYIDEIRDIFKADEKTHGMNAEERLDYLKKNALPKVEAMAKIIEKAVLNKIVLPKSELGEFFTYFLNQYDLLLLPFKVPGIPLHNNLSEWCTYLVARYLANSKAFRNTVGAAIGDVIMTIILLAYLSNTNPYEYILYCLQHKEEMSVRPQDFLPWKLRDKIKGLPSHKKMNFWHPPPPSNINTFAD